MTTPELGWGLAVKTTANGEIISAGESMGNDLFDFSVRRQTAPDGADVWHHQLDGSGSDIQGSYNDYAGDGSYAAIATTAASPMLPRWTLRVKSLPSVAT